MRRGVGRIRRSAAALAVIALTSAACAGSDDPSEPPLGADTERPATPALELVRFVDVAADVGLDFRHSAFQWGTSADTPAMMSGGVCWIDYDADGWLDLFATNTWSDGEWGRWREAGGLPTTHLYRNERGRFRDVSEDTGAGLAMRAAGCVAADLDRDGWTDLYVTSDRENVLLWNDHGDSFHDGAAAAGVDEAGWQTGAAAGDIDGNGWPDLVVAGYVDLNAPIAGASQGFPNTHAPQPDLLFLNDGPDADGLVHFSEAGAIAGLEPGGAQYGLGVVLTDVDVDGDLDVYVANDTQPNALYLNVAEPDDVRELGFRLVDQGVALGVGDENSGMGVASGDYDGGGLADLVVTNMDDQGHRVFRNVGGPASARFENALASMGLPDLGVGSAGWGTSWADIDLDTDLDLLLVHGAIPVQDLDADRQAVQVFANETADGTPGRFVDAAAAVGIDALDPYLARGAAVADYDNDGDPDLVIGTIGGALALLRNSGAGGHWLLVAPDPPSPGARVTVTLEDGTVLEREIFAGSSYLSSEDPRAHFGLGTATAVRSVRVDWPDGASTTLEDVDADQIVVVPQD